MKNYLFQRTNALSLLIIGLVLGCVLQVSAIAQGGAPSGQNLYWYITMPSEHTNGASVGNSVDGNNTLGLITTDKAPASSTFTPSHITESGFQQIAPDYNVPASLQSPLGNGPFVFGQWAQRSFPYWWSVSIYRKNELSKDINEIKSIAINVVGNYPFNTSTTQPPPSSGGANEAQDFVVLVYETTTDTIQTGNTPNVNTNMSPLNCMYLPPHIDNAYNMNELYTPVRTIQNPDQNQFLGSAVPEAYIQNWVDHGAFVIERKTLKIADFTNDAWIEFAVPAGNAGYEYKGHNLVVVMLQVDRKSPAHNPEAANADGQIDAGNSQVNPNIAGSHYIRNYRQEKVSWFAARSNAILQSPTTYNWNSFEGHSFDFNNGSPVTRNINQGAANWALRLGVDVVKNDYTGALPAEGREVALATPNFKPQVQYEIPAGLDRDYDVAMFSYKIVNSEGEVVYRAISGNNENFDTLFTAVPEQTTVEFVRSTGLYSDGNGRFVLSPTTAAETAAEAGDYEAIITWQTFRSNSQGADLNRKGVWPTRAQQVITVPFSIILPVARVEGTHPTWNTTVTAEQAIESISQPGVVVNALREGSPMPSVRYSIHRAAANPSTGDLTEVGDLVYTAWNDVEQDEIAVALPPNQTMGRFTFNFTNATGDIVGTNGQFDVSKLTVGKYYVNLAANYSSAGSTTEDFDIQKYDSFWVAYQNELELVELISPRTADEASGGGSPATIGSQYKFPANTPLKLEYRVKNWGATNCDAHIFTAEIYGNTGTLLQTIVDTNYISIKFASSDIFVSNKTFSIANQALYTIKTKVDFLTQAERNREKNKNDNTYSHLDDIYNGAPRLRYFYIQPPYNVAFTTTGDGVFPLNNDYRYPHYPTIAVTNNGSADINGVEVNLVVTQASTGRVLINETKSLSNITGTGRNIFKFDTLFFPEEIGQYWFDYTYTLPGVASTPPVPRKVVTIDGGLGTPGTTVVQSVGSGSTFTTIKQAMNALYRQGIEGHVIFELNPSIAGDNFEMDASYLDFRSKIVGAGPNATITFRPASRYMTEANPIILNVDPSTYLAGSDGLRSDDWFGIGFGDAPVSRLDTAAVNKVLEPEWKRYFAESNGYITIDGGDRKNIEIRFAGGFNTSNNWLAAPVYLGPGSKSISIKNCRIISSVEAMRGSSTVPVIYYDNNSSTYADGFRYEALSLEDGTANTYTTAGVFMFARPLDAYRWDNVLYNFNKNVSENNVVEGNFIEGFGYGVFSLGMGANIENNTLVPKYNKGTVISNNLIKSSGQSGIFLGFEENATVSGNRIYNITTATGDVYGISVGQATTEDRTVTPGGSYWLLDGMQLNMNNYNVTISRNEINGIRAQANNRAFGILVTEPVDTLQYLNKQFVSLDQIANSYKTNTQPATNNLYTITNNLVYELTSIGGTDFAVGKAGIAVLPSKAGLGVLPDDGYEQTMRKVNKVLVANNTVIIDDETSANLGHSVNCANFNVAGIKLFDVNSYEIINNAVAIKIDTTYKYDYISALALRSQNPKAVPTNITVNNNAYSVFESISYSSGGSVYNDLTAFVRFFELDKYGRWLNKEAVFAQEYDKLRNWYSWTGSDKNSIVYNFLAEMQARTGAGLAQFWTGDATTIRRMLPMDNRLTQLDKGFALSYVFTDIDNTDRHLLGKRFNIGAIEFNSQHATYDVMVLAISNPVAYLNSQASYSTGTEEQVMLTYSQATEGIRPTAIIKNDGTVPLANVPVICTIQSSEIGATATMVDTVFVTLSVGTEKEITFFTKISKRFVPRPYEEAGISSRINAKYLSMKRNITPIYTTEVRIDPAYSNSHGDANRGNDRSSISSRFFVPKSERGLLVSAKYSQNELYKAEFGQRVPSEMNREIIAGRLNYDTVVSALNFIGFAEPVGEGDPIYYDVLERTAWEPRSTVYGQYSGVIYSDALNDAVDYWEKKPLLDYANNATIANKRTLIAGSEGLLSSNYNVATDPFDKELSDKVLRSKNPATVTWTGQLFITGAGHNMNSNIELLNTGYQAEDPNSLGSFIGDANPAPKYFTVLDTAIGKNTIAYYQHETRNVLVLSSKLMERNMIHSAIDWRHLQNAGAFMEGIFGDVGHDIHKPDPPLAINLANLNANAIGKKVIVDWTTLNESGIANFEVQRADVYNNLAGLFASIDSKHAKGLINKEANYSVSDENVSYGKEYAYRLKINNVDGKYTYSYSKNVNIEYANGMSFGEVTPNPVSNSANTEFTLAQESNVKITINDLSGREIATLFNGIAAAGAYPLTIDATNLTSGTYTIIYNIDGNVVKTAMFNVAK